MLSGSALTDEVAVPDGHYAEETMKLTIVPNRNAIMLTVAFGLAAARKARAVAVAGMGAIISSIPTAAPVLSTRSKGCRTRRCRAWPKLRWRHRSCSFPRPIS